MWACSFLLLAFAACLGSAVPHVLENFSGTPSISRRVMREAETPSNTSDSTSNTQSDLCVSSKKTVIPVLGGYVLMHFSVNHHGNIDVECTLSIPLPHLRVVSGSVVTKVDVLEDFQYNLCIDFAANDLQCHLVPIKERTPVAQSLAASTLNCPHGWFLFGSSCFQKSATKERWTVAVQACSALHAQLATITNTGEQMFVKGMAGMDSVWIGLSDMELEGSYIWVDGSPYDFQYFHRGEPNDIFNSQEEDCIEMRNYYNHEWNDVKCSIWNHYVCKKAAE